MTTSLTSYYPLPTVGTNVVAFSGTMGSNDD